MQTNSLNSFSRLLPWEASLNSREMGGYPLQDGRKTRWKALVRSESLYLLNVAGQQALVDYGIRTVIDLRFQTELERWPNPFSTVTGHRDGVPDFLHIPLDQDQDLDWHEGADEAAVMCDLYIRLLETNRAHFARVLAAAAYARPGGVLFHCHAGKDRTGLIAAMVLGVLGAPAEVIVADYAFANPRLQERIRRTVSGPETPAEKRGYFRAAYSSHPETMRRTLAYLERSYGGIEGFLQTTPVQSADLAVLRKRLIEVDG